MDRWFYNYLVWIKTKELNLKSVQTINTVTQCKHAILVLVNPTPKAGTLPRLSGCSSSSSVQQRVNIITDGRSASLSPPPSVWADTIWNRPPQHSMENETKREGKIRKGGWVLLAMFTDMRLPYRFWGVSGRKLINKWENYEIMSTSSTLTAALARVKTCSVAFMPITNYKHMR